MAKPKFVYDPEGEHVRNQDGSIPFVWVSDNTTGHRYDVRADVVDLDRVTPVANYPVSYISRPGKAKGQDTDLSPAAPANPAAGITAADAQEN